MYVRHNRQCGTSMGNAVLVTLWLLLHCSCSKALLPGVRIVGVRRSMSNLRRRVTHSNVAQVEEDQDHALLGSLRWDNRRQADDESLGGDDRATDEADPARAPLIPRRSSSVIHLGKLKIPDSRRLRLTTTSKSNSHEARPFAAPRSNHPRSQSFSKQRTIADTTLESLEPDGNVPPSPCDGDHTVGLDTSQEPGTGRADQGREVEARRAADVEDISGQPSIIPFAMSDGHFEKGVLQIPFGYTVAETVSFIRTVATVDKHSLKTASTRKSWARTAAADEEDEAESESDTQQADDSVQATLSSRMFVTEGGRLKGYITMAALLTHDPDTPVADLLRDRDQEELLREGDDWEEAAHRLRHANTMATPVVDKDDFLVAVLHPSDLLQEMEIEATDDIMRQSGSGGGESYFGTPLTRLVASRVGWLVSLLALQSFSSLILQSYQNVIEKNIVIALFLTMLTGTAGNAGNQSSAIVIRGLATGEIHGGNRWRVIWREARAAVASAAVLSLASFARVMMTPGATTVATGAVATAMGATVIGAVMFGTVAPIVLDGMGVDPVNFASPALATLTDVSGVFILCSIAKIMLGSAA